MKPFELFKAGKHTAASGQTLDFSEDMLRAAVAAYDPALHEAPIVVGHPKDNHPAFGWIKALEFGEDGKVKAVPDQVNADFAELVQSGAYKKRSASWYLPDSPSNPKPGTLYLRHVAFLGAQPPAIKGLRDVSFSDNEEGVVEFADSYTTSIIASTFRRIREWIIGEKGVDEADKVIPAYVVSDLEAEARRPMETPAPAASFNEPEHDMKPEEIQALQAKAAKVDELTAKVTELEGKVASFAEREAAVAAGEAKILRGEIEARVDAAVKAGKVLPAQKKQVVDFAMGLAAGEATVDFGEGDQAKKVTQREAYLLQLENGPKVVEFGERAPAPGAKGAEGLTDQEIAAKASAYRDKLAAEGQSISFSEAVDAVHAGKAG